MQLSSHFKFLYRVGDGFQLVGDTFQLVQIPSGTPAKKPKRARQKAGSELLGWNPYQKPVELRGHFDLTRQPARLLNVKGKIEHIFFHRRWLADFRSPGIIDVDVAGRACAGTTALGINPGDAIELGRFHNGQPWLSFDRL